MVGKLLGGPCMDLRVEEKPCKFITTCLQQKENTFTTALSGLRKRILYPYDGLYGYYAQMGGFHDLKKVHFLFQSSQAYDFNKDIKETIYFISSIMYITNS